MKREKKDRKLKISSKIIQKNLNNAIQMSKHLMKRTFRL